jgi:transposase
MLYSGIDLHKRSLVIHTLDAAGASVAERELPTDRRAVRAYFAVLPGPHRAVVECTSSWYWLRDLLVPEGIDLRLGHAKYLRAISYAKVKTDRVDARTLAQLLRVNLVPEAHMIDPARREWRDLLRARLELVVRQMRCRHTLGGLLEKYNVPTPERLPPLVRLQATLQTEQQVLLTQHLAQVEAELRRELLPTPPVQRLAWVPGIGHLVAYTIVLEVDDIRRFPTVRHFHSYCRLVPGAANSGGKTRHRRSRDGNRYLKLAFHHAAIRAVQYFPEVKAEYQRWTRRKGKAIARALVAKELATIVYAMLTKDEPFNNTFHGHVVTTEKQARWPRLASPARLTDARPRANARTTDPRL